MTAAELNHFDRSKPFYPLVMDFITGVYGWVALASRGVGQLAARLPAEQVKTEFRPDVPVADLAAAASLPSLVKPIQLTSRVQGIPITIDHDELAGEVIQEHHYLLGETVRAPEHLLLLAWETTHEFHTRDPLWEFLRHCRNAAGHQGRFNLKDGKPRRPARWGELEIAPELSGTRLFDGPSSAGRGVQPIETGLLAVGDAVALLWDIEQAFPDLTVSSPEAEDALRDPAS